MRKEERTLFVVVLKTSECIKNGGVAVFELVNAFISKVNKFGNSLF